MQATHVELRKGDWIRFQRTADRLVLEGFVQEISEDGSKMKVGKAPYSPETAWHALSEVAILRTQSR